MERTIQVTTDGSSTVYLPGMEVTYHSKHGALQESRHVFIDAGLRFYLETFPGVAPLRIFEMGLGTGLNALLTEQYTRNSAVPVCYEAMELYPLREEEWSLLNYTEVLEDTEELFRQLHEAPWEQEQELRPGFLLRKTKADLSVSTPVSGIRLVYYDAFAPGAQPQLWTEELFRRLYLAMDGPAVLVTYCSKSDVRRALQAAGFQVQKIPGPPGKREMLRALKG